MSTTCIGDQFRDRIAALLDTKYDNVRTEIELTAKKADILFESRNGPRRVQKIAAECKKWNRSLTRDQVQKIIFDYEPARKNNEIDELWIVCDQTPSVHAREYADSYAHCQLMTALECEHSIINFDPLLNFLVNDFNRDDISKYFIQPSYEETKDGLKHDLHAFIDHWLVGTDDKPIAIWAGYGMGKTSYARFLACQLAKRCQKNPSARIPILLNLGDFTTAPDLESYLLIQLTNFYGVRFLSSTSFRVLNKAQRFVLILDGFDEMKFAMAPHDFNFISSQIRSMVADNSKLLLLGRPSAIQSDDEEQRLTSSRLQLPNLAVKTDRAADFINLSLSTLTEEQYLSLIRNYVAIAADDVSRPIDDIIAQVKALGLGDILSRPVQAKMLAEVVADPTNNIANISRFTLYDMFIKLVLRREEQKSVRRHLDATKRLHFMRLLAWWLWTEKKTRTFAANEIPVDIIQKFNMEGVTPEGLRRELLVGSVIEGRRVGHFLSEKAADVFYFPHISFTEFLVADYILSADFMSPDIAELPTALYGEVPTFLNEHPSKDGVLAVYSRMKNANVAMTRSCVSVLLNDFGTRLQVEVANTERTANPWDICLNYFLVTSSKTEDAGQFALDCLKSLDRNTELAAIFCLIYHAALNVAERESTTARLIVHIFERLGFDSLATAVLRGSAITRSAELNHLATIAVSCIEIFPRPFSVSFDFSEFAKQAVVYFGMSCSISDLIETMPTTYSAPSNGLLSLVKDSGYRASLGEVLHKGSRLNLTPSL
jgi:NACHT domain